jgi:type IV pilus assembly protein PilM
MRFLSSISTGSLRPRLVCEIRSGSVTAARADDATRKLAQVAFVELPDGTLAPSLREGNVLDRAALVAALRKALESVNVRTRDVTLIVPDAAVRVLLLDFDTLPSKAADAIAVVRFRLTKLLPFEPESAAVSYQIISQGRGTLQVLAVAMPRAILAEYEGAVRDAGFEPGSVLPSTLAAVGALQATEPVLLINAGTDSITTAITRRGEVLLHRTLDLARVVRVEIAVNAEGEAPAPLVPYTALEKSDFVAIEMQQAITVAAAYFEDSLGFGPREIFITGERDAEAAQFAREIELEPKPVLASEDVLATATSQVPRAYLAGVRGATSF